MRIRSSRSRRTSHYAHAYDSRSLTGSTDFFASDNTNNGNWIPTTTATMFIENIEFSLGSRTFRALCQTAGARPVLCFKNCDFYNSANSNNIAIQGPFDVYLQDCNISGGWQDGDNIHGDTVGGSPRVLELRCDIGRNGYSASGANNASTEHEDARIVSVNSTYRTSESRVIHDITTCKRWMLGCTIGASLSAVPDEASAVQVDDSATIWLDSCTITHNATATGDLHANDPGSAIYFASNMDVSALTAGGAVREYSPAF